MVASIEMVIYAAVGGRLSIPGAVVGALLIGFLKSYLSETFPEAWLYFLGGSSSWWWPSCPTAWPAWWASCGRDAPQGARNEHGIGPAGAPAMDMSMQADRPGEGAILSVEDLTVVFDGFKAVDGLSLSVARDELRVIIGPNGAGKTTLLDMICGKTRPTSGRVMFQGRDLSRMAEHQIVRAGVGRKFQTPSVTRT